MNFEVIRKDPDLEIGDPVVYPSGGILYIVTEILDSGMVAVYNTKSGYIVTDLAVKFDKVDRVKLSNVVEFKTGDLVTWKNMTTTYVGSITSDNKVFLLSVKNKRDISFPASHRVTDVLPMDCVDWEYFTGTIELGDDTE